MKLNACQLQNKLYTDELFDGITLRQPNIDIPCERLFSSHFKQLERNGKFKRVLDLGCGDGFLTLNLLHNIEEIYGLDVSPNALLAFQKNIQKHKIDKKIVLVCSPAEETPFSDNYFDAVVCYRFIHHLSLKPLLREVNRVLKKGGYFICLGEPYLDYTLTYFKRSYYTLINRAIFKPKTKKFLYSKAYIQKLLRQEGFSEGEFHFSKFLFLFAKVFLIPFYSKFPRLQPLFNCILKFVYKIDLNIFEKIIFKKFLQEISFYAKKII